MIYSRIVIKVGTHVITDEEGQLMEQQLRQLSEQVAELIRSGVQVLLVSSGAVAAGRQLIPGGDRRNRVLNRQVLSAVGQARLMRLYQQHFALHQLPVAQVLATKEDFRDRRHYLNMKGCLEALLHDEVVPILNENDVVSVSELMFTDNDELAGLLAAMVNAQALFLLSSVAGLFDGPPEKETSRLLSEVDPFDRSLDELILPTRSAFGRGGMHTKLRVARRASKLGITTILADGKAPDIIRRLAAGESAGTRFQPQSDASSVKKWLAHQEGAKGEVFVNAGAAAALRHPERVSSLLPVGITHIEGEFEKGDIVKLYHGEEQLGIGMAQYGSARARQHAGQRGHKPLVHYDYLFVFPTKKSE